MLGKGVKNGVFPKMFACSGQPPAKYLASGDRHGEAGLDQYTTPQDFLLDPPLFSIMQQLNL